MLLQAPQKEFWSFFVSVYHLFLCVQAPLMGQDEYLSGLFFLIPRAAADPGRSQVHTAPLSFLLASVALFSACQLIAQRAAP